MNKPLLAAALLILASTGASAQDTQPRYRGQGYVVFGLGPSFQDQFGRGHFVKYVGGGGEGFLFKGIGLGAEAGYAHWGEGVDHNAWIASADFSYHFARTAPKGKIDPFVLAGATLYAPTEHGERGAPAANFGGGVNIWLRDHAGLRLEARHHYQYEVEFGPGANYLSIRIGVTFR
jgi:opacity protein-like surface antigen